MAVADPSAPAEVLLPCADLGPTLAFFDGLGFRIETIFPADAPKVASLSGHGLRIRLGPGRRAPATLRIPGRAGEVLTAPNGTRIEFYDPDPPIEVPPLAPGFVLTRAGGGSGEGRAGMLYRDLIPGRLGGRFIASHISIPDGGPVADWVHFHKVRFQMIFCAQGWVEVVYEDQGPPFVMHAGDCVLQPPRIRHRVLEASPGLEVVEIGCPAQHETLADHDLALPTHSVDPHRDFSGQVFLRHEAAKTPWTPAGHDFEAQVTGMAQATRGLAGVRVLRKGKGKGWRYETKAAAELQFGFVLEGQAALEHAGPHRLARADAFVIPSGDSFALTDASDDFRLLEVTLPA